MTLITTILPLATWATLATSHAVILAAQGEAGSPASVGFQVVNSLPRNCTAINACQLDSTLIRDAEISANIVNECGRTEMQGNIDVGENTENALAAKAVTQVKANSVLTVTIHQVNADGSGPFTVRNPFSNIRCSLSLITNLSSVIWIQPATRSVSQAKPL